MNSDQVVLDSKRCWSTSMIGNAICPPGRRVPVPLPEVSRAPTRTLSGLVDGRPQSVEPVVGRLPGSVGLASLLGPVFTGRGIRAQELHPGEPGVQVAEAVGNDLVADVSRKVDHEAVVAQRLLGGARLELGQVDVARGELPEDPVQASGMVRALEADDARLVVAG